MTDFALAIFVLVAAGLLAWRAAEDAAAPKLVLVRSEWACRRSHAEPTLRVTPAPDGDADRALVPVMVCDSWSRR